VIKTVESAYPRTPKMNAHCELFNRTLQDELVDYNLYDFEKHG